MNIYSSFGLGAPPFESRPDPRYFFRASGHAETLATLEFAARTAKTCTLVIGESGVGKTLVALIAADRANVNNRIVWVHGLAPAEGDAPLTVFPRGTLGLGTLPETARPSWGTLRAWTQRSIGTSVPTVVIVDHADHLPVANWTDLLTLATRDARGSRPATLILLGTPGLLERMATRRLARLRRRLFRTCTLRAFEAENTAAYIRHRMEVAGGSAAPFTPDALVEIQRYARGIPACINQICDGALVDAFGDDRTTVEAEHIRAAVRGIHGPRRRARALPSAMLRQLGPGPLPLFAENAIDLPPDRRVVVERLELMCAGSAPHEAMASMLGSAGPSPRVVSATVSEVAPASTPVEVACAPQPQPQPEGRSAELQDRIQHIETRVSAVLTRVRAVRMQAKSLTD
jgi:general secretion pathway protein A